MEELRHFIGKLIIILSGILFLMILIIGGYVSWAYYQSRCDFAAREQQIVRPAVGEGSISETGYVMSAQESTCLKNQKKRFIWSIQVPATKKTYICEWQYGFAGFRKDDAVILIHKAEGAGWSPEFAGYLIGKTGKVKEKPSCVWTFGVVEDDHSAE